MKQLYIFLFIALTFIGLNGCSTYKSSATPDDVYGSQGTQADVASGGGSGNDYYSTPNENYVRMRVQDPNRWGYFDDYNYDYNGGGYGYSPSATFSGPYYGGIGYGLGTGFGYSGLGTGFGYGFGYSPFFGTGLSFGYGPFSYWDSYYLWNSYYNPYYGGVLVVNGKNTSTSPLTRAANFNPAAYSGRSAVSTRPAYSNRLRNGNVTTLPNYYGSRPRSGFTNGTNNTGNYNRPSYDNNSGNNRPAYSRPSMSSQPMRSAPSSNFGGGGGGGSMRGGGMSRPGR